MGPFSYRFQLIVFNTFSTSENRFNYLISFSDRFHGQFGGSFACQLDFHGQLAGSFARQLGSWSAFAGSLARELDFFGGGAEASRSGCFREGPGCRARKIDFLETQFI